MDVRRRFFALCPAAYLSRAIDMAVRLGWSPADVDALELDMVDFWVARWNQMQEQAAASRPRVRRR